MLFDIVRDLNESIHESMSGGMPTAMIPRVFGTTDGFNAQITFMDTVVWDSATWEYTTEDEAVELRVILFHIREAIHKHLSNLYNIRF